MFPNFVTIELSHQAEIEAYTRQFPPYSDFNFASLYSWNASGEIGVAWLKGNLVFKFSDYITNETFLSFIGCSKVRQTISLLLAEAVKQGYQSVLKLVPEHCVGAEDTYHGFQVIDDRDNHDYLLCLETLALLAGGKQAHTRELVNRFVRDYGPQAAFRSLDTLDRQVKQQLQAIFEVREAIKTDNNEQNERVAFNRLLELPEHFKLAIFGVFITGQLEAFIVCELLSNHQVMAHFWKANTNYRGIYHYLLNQTSKVLDEQGFKTMNFEQDLGVPSLRQAKQFLRPSGYLKKYTVTYA